MAYRLIGVLYKQQIILGNKYVYLEQKPIKDAFLSSFICIIFAGVDVATHE